MNWKISRLFVALCYILITAGCMSIYDISSDPSGANVLLNGNPQGTTPLRIETSPGTKGTITVKKDGYDSASRILMPPTVAGQTQQYHFILEQERQAPVSFVQTMEPSWASIELRDGVNYDNAWNTIVDLLIRKFDMEVLSKENGYMRTTWLFSWTGQLREDYRVRVTVKFSPDHKKVDVKSEANYQTKNGWITGSDTALLQTLKTDLMGTVGRTTR